MSHRWPLAYGMIRTKAIQKLRFMIFEGTFDVSIIEIAEVDEHQFEVLSTNGDTFLGGEISIEDY